jgi:hypothetical protein
VTYRVKSLGRPTTNPLFNNPVVNTIGGAVNGVWTWGVDTVKGVADIATYFYRISAVNQALNPDDYEQVSEGTRRVLRAIAADPFGAGQKVIESIKNQYVDMWNENPAKAITYGILDVFGPGKVLNALGDVAKVEKVSDIAADLERVVGRSLVDDAGRLNRTQNALPPAGGTVNNGFGGSFGDSFGRRPNVPQVVEGQEMSKWYDLALNGEKPNVLGRFSELDALPPNQYQKLQSEHWTPLVNDAYVSGAIDRSLRTRTPIRVASDPTQIKTLLSNPTQNRFELSVTARELQQLHNGGFTMQQNSRGEWFAVPPGQQLPDVQRVQLGLYGETAVPVRPGERVDTILQRYRQDGRSPGDTGPQSSTGSFQPNSITSQSDIDLASRINAGLTSQYNYPDIIASARQQPWAKQSTIFKASDPLPSELQPYASDLVDPLLARAPDRRGGKVSNFYLPLQNPLTGQVDYQKMGTTHVLNSYFFDVDGNARQGLYQSGNSPIGRAFQQPVTSTAPLTDTTPIPRNQQDPYYRRNFNQINQLTHTEVKALLDAVQPRVVDRGSATSLPNVQEYIDRAQPMVLESRVSMPPCVSCQNVMNNYHHLTGQQVVYTWVDPLTRQRIVWKSLPAPSDRQIKPYQP